MSRPSLHTEVYAAIAPEALAGANRGKVAVVTGAAQGIGRAIARSLARSGANVALLDLDMERQAQTKTECEEYGAIVFAYECDVTKVDVCESIFNSIERDLGPVDILINNAGRNARRPMAMESFEKFWAGVELNLKGAMICTHIVLPSMRKREHGCIINIASRAGTVNTPFAGAYSTAKAGLIRATGVLQAEQAIDGFGDEIHLYALHPGAVKTTMTLPVDNDIKEKYPDTAAAWAKFHNLFKVQPDVCGQTCAFLAAGRGKMLKGRYFDCEQNIQEVIDAGEPGLQGCYEMKVDFAGGLPNDGGTAFSVVEKSN